MISKYQYAREQVVVVRGGDNDQLVAYVSFHKYEGENPKEELRSYLKEYLPDYMIPDLIVEIDKLPLNSNGKIDRKALPEPTLINDITKVHIPPSSIIEKELVQIWMELLGSKKISVKDNFFELGGNSLLAAKFIWKVNRKLNKDLRMQVVFSHPTVRELSQILQEESNNRAIRIKETKKRNINLVTNGFMIPVSYAQSRIWLMDQLIDNKSVYNIASEIDISGNLDEKILEDCLNEIVSRHETLRTYFEMVDGELMQIIKEAQPLYFEHVNLGNLSGNQKEKQCNVIAKREATYQFNLSSPPLLRAVLVQLNNNEYKLFLTLHHIIADGWSVGVLVREMSILYDAALKGKSFNLPALEIQYADFSEWERESVKEGRLDEKLEFWKEYLSGEIPVLELPTNYPRSSNQTFKGAIFEFKIPSDLTKAIKELGNKENTTLYMTLLSAFKIFLYRLSGQTDILVGSPAANRNQEETENLIGFFVNNLVLRTGLTDKTTFYELLNQVKTNATSAYSNQDVPFDKIVEQASISRSNSFSPLFQVMFALQNMPRETLELENLDINISRNQNNTSKYDLLLEVTENDDELISLFEYNTTLFNEETISQWTNYFINILKEIVANPNEKISRISLLGSREREEVIDNFNQTAFPFSRNKTLTEIFEEQVDLNPDKIAVTYEDKSLTYSELNKRANQVARELRHQGVTTETIVGIMVDRSIEMVTGIFGILKAGGAYLPILPEYPKERISFILNDSEVNTIITQKKYKNNIDWVKGNILAIDSKEFEELDTSNLKPIHNERNLAYIIYTSGSTGNPKGVMIEHFSVINRIEWMIRELDFTSTDVFLQKASFVFDFSVWELFGWSFLGASLSLLKSGDEKDPYKIIEKIEEEKVTHVHFSPSMLNIFLESLEDPLLLNRVGSLRRVSSGGEVLQLKHVKQFKETLYKQHGIELTNMYGPTETTIDVTSYHCTFEEDYSIPIGKPIQNVQMFILDANNEIQPPGVPGELCISGECLARGYINQEKLTKEKFVEHPYKSGKMYRTGDVAKWLPDGNIEYLGRVDHQVKLRGFRIELDEVETVISKYQYAREQVVVVRGGDNDQLVAYVSFHKYEGENPKEELRSYLKEYLPDYMIPDLIVEIDKLPLNSNGKIDRKALPEPGIRDNFFELGGHSLLAAKLAWEINNKLDENLSMQDIFTYPTVKDTAEFMEGNSKNKSPKKRISHRKNKEIYPLTAEQQGIWFQEQMISGSSAYNMSLPMEIKGELNIEILEKSFMKLVKRHEILRANFKSIRGLPKQVVKPSLQLMIDKVRCTHMSKSEIGKEIEAEAFRPFDISDEPLIRVKLLITGINEYVLMITMHHIISDAVSFKNLVEEVITFYSYENEKEEVVLPNLPIQFSDYAEWQQNWINSKDFNIQVDYWLNKLAGAPVSLNLPNDYHRLSINNVEGSIFDFEIPTNIGNDLRKLANKEGVTLYMLFIAAWNILLSKISGSKDIVVGTSASGRNIDTERLIGLFVNTIPIRTVVKNEAGFIDYLQGVKTTVLEAFENQDLPFEMLLNKLKVKRDHSKLPLCQVFFSYQNRKTHNEIKQPNGLNLERIDLKKTTVRYDIVADIIDDEERLSAVVEYSTGLFKRETIKSLSDDYLLILERIAKNPYLSLKDLK
ncbi:non-ribosomal peptide synthetase [Rossellomorea vietnamensis]|uniref:non-ribosomal peptide synthetase n=1 Tax=Rossellomorea vietnamensis TaxID=218284 RepID=UPI001C02DE2A|nr:non-ribosomal peptide synthetase [Rossellomorea vietnamensis]